MKNSGLATLMYAPIREIKDILTSIFSLPKSNVGVQRELER